MKKIIIPAVAALSLAAAVPALAQPDDTTTQHDHDKNHNGDHQPQQHTDTHQQNGTHHEVPNQAPVMHENHIPPPQTHHENTSHMPPPAHNTTQRYDWNNYQQGHTPPVMRHAPQIDLHAWHRNANAPKRFHSGSYNRPNGWYSRRWTFGMVLPQLFWAREYWITDYSDYDLPDPPYGYVWVRDGDDALLVSVSSGYILQVDYDLFD